MNTLTKPNDRKMSQRKIDGYIKLAEVIQWGRKYPTRFIERFL